MKEIKTVCPLCGKSHIVRVKQEDHDRYVKGGLIQNCFPYLNESEREMLITGICDVCWNRMMA